MKTRKVKKIINELYGFYKGNKGDRYKALAKDLDVSVRWVVYRITGEKEANYLIADKIKSLIFEKKNK